MSVRKQELEHPGDANTSDTAFHACHRQRLNQRLKKSGLDSLAEHEVLEWLLQLAIPRKDTKATAHRLLRAFGSFSSVVDAQSEELMQFEGVGKSAALLLSTVPQLCRRYQRSIIDRSAPILNTAASAAEYMAALLLGRREEVFYTICLDNRCRVIFPALVSFGSVTHAHVSTRKVVTEALRHKAAHVLLAHNHPAGSLQPSDADLRLTHHLVTTLESIEIRVVDHVILAPDGAFFSFAQHGLLSSHGAG